MATKNPARTDDAQYEPETNTMPETIGDYPPYDTMIRLVRAVGGLGMFTAGELAVGIYLAPDPFGGVFAFAAISLIMGVVCLSIPERIVRAGYVDTDE